MNSPFSGAGSEVRKIDSGGKEYVFVIRNLR